MPRYGGVGAAIGTAAGSFGKPLHVADAGTTGLLLAAAPTGETVLAWSTPMDVGAGGLAVRAAHATAFGAARRAPCTSADLAPHQAARQGVLATLADGTMLFAGPDGGRDGIRLAIPPPGGRFARARLILPAAFQPDDRRERFARHARVPRPPRRRALRHAVATLSVQCRRPIEPASCARNVATSTSPYTTLRSDAHAALGAPAHACTACDGPSEAAFCDEPHIGPGSHLLKEET